MSTKRQMNEYTRKCVLYGTPADLLFFNKSRLFTDVKMITANLNPFYTYILLSELEALTIPKEANNWHFLEFCPIND